MNEYLLNPEYYPYGKYKLVKYVNLDYKTEIYSVYFDYFRLKKYSDYLEAYYDDSEQVLMEGIINVSIRLYICHTIIKRDGDWTKLYLWNPETNSHDILVGEWHA